LLGFGSFLNCLNKWTARPQILKRKDTVYWPPYVFAGGSNIRKDFISRSRQSLARSPRAPRLPPPTPLSWLPAPFGGARADGWERSGARREADCRRTDYAGIGADQCAQYGYSAGRHPYGDLGYGLGDLPISEAAADQFLSLRFIRRSSPIK